MRITHVYPEDAQQGDTFVVEEITVSPTTVEIHLGRFVPKADERDVLNKESLYIADRIVQCLQAERGEAVDPQLYLLIQAYRSARPPFRS